MIQSWLNSQNYATHSLVERTNEIAHFTSGDICVIFTNCISLRNVFCLPGTRWQRRRKTQRGKRVVKYLIGDNLIHLLVLETRSPARQRLKRFFCHLLFVSVRVIRVPRGRLSVARLHENIPSDPGHYQPIQRQRSLLTCVSPRSNLLGPRLSLTQLSR